MEMSMELILGILLLVIGSGVLGVSAYNLISKKDNKEETTKENFNKNMNLGVDDEDEYQDKKYNTDYDDNTTDINNVNETHEEFSFNKDNKTIEDRRITCSFCFEDFNENEALFRCLNPDCVKINDEIFQRFWDTEEKTNIFFEGSGDKAICPECHTQTAIKICPKCHNEIISYNEKPISLVGGKTSGKTVYITTLIKELRDGDIGHIYDFSTLMHLKYSINKYKELENLIFYQRILPEPTKSIVQNFDLRKPFALEIIKDSKKIPLILFDTAGEDMFDPHRMVSSLKYITKSSGLIILLDLLTERKVLEQLDLINNEYYKKFWEESLSPSDFINNIYLGFRDSGLLSYLGKIDIPTAIVIPKIDIYKEKGLLTDDNVIFALKDRFKTKGLCKNDLDRLEEEVKSLIASLGLQALVRIIDDVFSDYRYFAVSSLGFNPKKPPKLEKAPEPIRVAEPLLWLLSKKNIVKDKC